MTELASATWPDLPQRPLVLVPSGSVEQHGPHLPFDTDAVIAAAVAAEAASRLEAVVAPPLVYGNSGEHQSFPGTMSIGAEALRLVVVELVRSLSTWAGRIVFVNAHGGNAPTLADAVKQLCGEGHDVTWVPCATEEVDLHAGHTETSLMLHLRPGGVRLDRAAAGNTAPLAEILPAMMAGGVGAVSPNGVLGDPAGASADHGRAVLDAMVDDVCRRIGG